jgi:hypothetical protein
LSSRRRFDSRFCRNYRERKRSIPWLFRWSGRCLVGATEGRNFCQPSRILATPEFKADEENRTELKANSFLWTMLADFYTKYPSTRARFPSEGLVATPEFLLSSA